MGYHPEGRFLGLYSRHVLCSCWIGEDSGNGTCDAIVTWHIDKGTAEGTDVGGNTMVALIALEKNVRRVQRLSMPLGAELLCQAFAVVAIHV